MQILSSAGVRYVLRRIAVLVVLLGIISFCTFSLLSLAPGSLERVLLGTQGVSQRSLEAVRAQYHLNDPFLERYVRWLGEAARLNFGHSIRTGEGVTAGIAQRAGVTLTLGLMSFVLLLCVGVPLGVLAATRRGGGVDRAIVGGSVIGVSAPPFATGVILILVFAVSLHWFPSFGAGSGFVDRLWHLLLPSIALALTAGAVIVKVVRAGLVRELDQDYVVFARARGLTERHVLFRYALRNALVPVLTASGLILGYLVGGAVLVEVAFGLPGLGSLLVTSIEFKDLPMVQGVVMAIAAFVLGVNLLTDLLYAAVDPRIRLGSEASGG